MLDHGLPVMVTRNDYVPRGNIEVESLPDRLLIRADRDVSGCFLAGLPTRAPHPSVADLASNLVHWMEGAASPSTGRG
jgi:hypothetical protein